MRAAYYDAFGAARSVLRVGEIPDPIAAPGEVLVRVHASGINPSDVKSRNNASRPMPFPRIVPHSDGAGEIVAVGEGVDRARIGQRVWLWNGQWNRAFGTASELITLPDAQAIELPESVPFEVGACLGIPMLTAWRAVHWRPRQRGDETMLVTGGAGAVSQYAIQIAKRAGYRVITTVSSDEKAAIVRSLGADAVVDYRQEDVAAAIRQFTEGQGVDRIVEVNLNGNAQFYPAWIKHDGLAIVYGSNNWSPQLPLRPWLDHGIEMAMFIVYNLPPLVRQRAVAECTALLLDKSFTHNVALSFDLESIVEAHEAVESGRVIGNVVLKI